jgi:hypothetical protein
MEKLPPVKKRSSQRAAVIDFQSARPKELARNSRSEKNQEGLEKK